jgi:uncharacterized protein (DUF1330 family)
MKKIGSILVAVAALFLASTTLHAPAYAQQQGPIYFVVELNVTNQEEFDRDYGGRAGALVAEHGGTFVVGGAPAEAVEGDAPEGVVIIVTFEDMESARSFLDAPEYQEIVPIRRRTAETRSYLVQGVAPQ